MESTADTHQRFQLRGVVCPARERGLDGRHFLASLLNEELDEIGIDMRIQLGRRRGHFLRVEHGGRHRRAVACRRQRFGSRHLRSGFSTDRRHQVDNRGLVVGQRLQHHRRGKQFGRQRRRLRQHQCGVWRHRRSRLRGFGQMHHHRQRRGGQGLQTGLGVIEHVFRVGTAGLERLHVVLDAHHRIGEAVEPLGSERRGGEQDVVYFHRQCRHDIAGALTVEHPEGRTDTPRQFIHGGGGHRHLLRHGTGHRFLDTRQIDDALAQHRGLHAVLFSIVPIMAGIAFLVLDPWGNQADERLVEPILHRDERSGHFHEQTIARHQTTSNHVLESSDFGPHARAQGTQVEHAQRVADLAQQLHLRNQFRSVLRAFANEDIQHVFDAREVFADSGTHRTHQGH